MEIFIETPRLYMREIVESDAQGMYELDSDPVVHKYLGNHPITTIEQAEASIQYIRNQYKENGIGRWAVINKATNEFMGWSGLKYETQVRDFPYYDLGYRFIQRFWRQGFGTETAIESLKYGFQTLDLAEICAGADVENTGSNKILTKIGLIPSGNFTYDNALCNWYALKKTEWLALQQQ